MVGTERIRHLPDGTIDAEAEKGVYEKGWDDAMKRLAWEFFDCCKRYDLNHFALHIFGRAKGKGGFSTEPDSAADVVRIVEKACLMTLANRNDNGNNET